MTCPVCQAHNSAMSVRCLDCGTVLISDALPRAEGVQRTADAFDNKLYMGYGGLIGFVLGMASWFVLSRDESVLETWLPLCALAGTAAGGAVAWRGRNRL